MPWKELSTMELKEEFIRQALKSEVNFKALCQSYNISRTTGYNTLKAYRQYGHKALESKSRKPDTSPNMTSDFVIECILAVRHANPRWGGRKIRAYLIKQGVRNMPSEKTCNRILSRYGCINPEESAKHKPYIRFEHAHPNDLWQMDFKGHFPTGQQRCHPFTLLDDHSRFSLAIISCPDETKETVIKALIDVFRTYGLPKRITMDNGSPWGYGPSQRYTEIDIWLIRLGINVSHSRPYHPQTQGKLERFHRTLKLELLSEYYFDTLAHAQEGFDWWRKLYNEKRPHEGIGLDVPESRYERSDRLYPETLPEIEFPSGVEIRRVDVNGKISYKGKYYRLGKGLAREPVGVRESEEQENMLDVFYCHQKVLELVK